jgi:uncharacterized protein
MEQLTLDWVKNNGLLVFEAITGSKAYGLDTAESDTDIRGVFVLPQKMYYGFEYTAQVSNASNDIVYYELKRYLELLSKNNPNILELLGLPESCILYQDEMMKQLVPQLFLSKLCEKTFADYAFTQIKKAYSLEKKIVNPVEGKRKSVLDFCFVYERKEGIPLERFLENQNLSQAKMGLAAIPHMKDCYNLFYSESVAYNGIIRTEEANEVCLSSIPKGEKPMALLYFNKDGYSVYCKRYKEYWEWVARRNEARYKTTMTHGKKYDSKNMLHVFRLLHMAKEIALEGKINVYRKDREYLLSIKEGLFEYDELVLKAEVIRSELPAYYKNSYLPDKPDIEMINELLISMRSAYYNKRKS